LKKNKKQRKKRREKSVFEVSDKPIKKEQEPVKKSKKKKGMVCKYCKFFFDSDKRRLEREGGTLLDYRICKKIGKEVMDLSEGCEEFELNPLFWCNKWDCWLNIIMCSSRRKREEEGCVRCRQGTLIESFSS